MPCPLKLQERMILIHSQIILRWLWLPLLMSLVMTILSIPNIRQKKFFSSIDLRGYDGKLPQYLGQRTINKYLKHFRFRARIPFEKWEKAKSELELFYRKKVYKMEQSKEDIRTVDLYMIQENLPDYIEWQDDFMEPGDRFAIGEGYMGKVVWDASAFPHGLVAGASGSGKTGILRCIIHQAIYKKYNVQVFDFKGGGDFANEAKKYYDMEKGYGPFIVSDPEDARQMLLGLVIEVQGRLSAFKEAGVSKIEEYNASGKGYFVPWLLVIDEAAELLDVKPKEKAERDMYVEIDHYLRTLARTSRAAGVHILMGFIRPDANVLDGQIKNNLLWRACGYFSDPSASRIVLDSDKATELPPLIKGRFIIGEEETQAYYMPTVKPEDKTRASGEAER